MRPTEQSELANGSQVAGGRQQEPSVPPAQPQDTRWAMRRPCKLSAQILADGLSVPVPCIVVDSSSTGAQLHLTTGRGGTPASSLPERFKVQIPFERVEIDCRIAWRRDKQLGVKYVSPARALAKPSKLKTASEQPKLKPKPKSLVSKLFGT